MTRIDALKELLEKVEAGEVENPPFWKVWLPENNDGFLAFRAHKSFLGSFDAGLILLDYVLPDRDWFKNTTYAADGKRANIEIEGGGSGTHKIAARALLIAIISTLISEAEA